MIFSVRLLIYLKVLIICMCCTGCMGGSIKTFDFVKYNGTGSHFNTLSCARHAQSEKACGCKMDIQNHVYHSVWKSPWCVNRTMQADYMYMETTTLRMSPALTSVTDQQWIYQGDIPVCMTPGARIEMKFTPRTGWTKIYVILQNIHSYRPVRLLIWNHSSTPKVEFRSVDGAIVHLDVGDGFPFVTDETYILEVEVLESSFVMYVNGTFYHEYKSVTNETAPVKFEVKMLDVESDWHYVEYRKGKNPSTTELYY